MRSLIDFPLPPMASSPGRHSEINGKIPKMTRGFPIFEAKFGAAARAPHLAMPGARLILALSLLYALILGLVWACVTA